MIDVDIPSGIKNIIFDLGGVILNIDYNKTSNAFKQLGLHHFDEIYSQKKQSGIFDQFETGQISEQTFINDMLRECPNGTLPKQIIEAWNAMLLDFPKARLNRLNDLIDRYNIFLLSNTNCIHEKAFIQILKKMHGLTSLDTLFNKVYYSHIIGLRKPNKEVFEYVLSENQLNKDETLFIDDSIQHVEGAKQLGLRTIYYK